MKPPPPPQVSYEGTLLLEDDHAVHRVGDLHLAADLVGDEAVGPGLGGKREDHGGGRGTQEDALLHDVGGLEAARLPVRRGSQALVVGEGERYSKNE